MQMPTSWSRYFDQPHGLLLNLNDSMLIPRYLHFMVSSVAIGGLAIALSFHCKRKRGDYAAIPWIGYGCRWFSYATLINFAIGLWFLAALPKGLLTTSNTTGLLLLLALTSGIMLALPAVMFGLTARVMPTIFCALGTIVSMIMVRSLLRATLLSPWFSVSQLPVTPAVSSLLFFLFFLTSGLALIVWMIRFALHSCAGGEARP
jgi:hypothetical protein